VKKKAVFRIPLAILHEAQLKLDEVIRMLEPYLVELSPPERQEMVRMGPESFEFVELSYGLVVENPELLPGFTEAASLGEGFSAVRELWILDKKLTQLKNYICDMEMATGDHVLEAALAFYQTVKIAARRDIPGARIIYEELKPKRPSGRRKQNRIKALKAV